MIPKIKLLRKSGWKGSSYNLCNLQSHIHWNSMICTFSSSFFTPFLLIFELGFTCQIKYFSLAFLCHQDFCQPTSGSKTMSKIATAVTNFEMYFKNELSTIKLLRKQVFSQIWQIFKVTIIGGFLRFSGVKMSQRGHINILGKNNIKKEFSTIKLRRLQIFSKIWQLLKITIIGGGVFIIREYIALTPNHLEQ